MDNEGVVARCYPLESYIDKVTNEKELNYGRGEVAQTEKTQALMMDSWTSPLQKNVTIEEAGSRRV